MERRCLPTAVAALLIAFACAPAVPSGVPRPATNRLATPVAFAGVRSSFYGIKPFPGPEEWETAIRAMSGRWPGSTPVAIWIVGRFSRPKGCRLEFPADGRGHPNIFFEQADRHEAYLDRFDRAGIKIFLQVEPAHADMKTLIDLVLGRYKHHPSVIGFGVDVEWYREADRPEWGLPVDDETGRRWESWVKAHDPAYRLFIKHWDLRWLCPSYRGDIVFVDDSQIFEGQQALVDEFEAWGRFFKPSPVFFQIGYRSDKPWWSRIPDPPKTLGEAIAARIEQDCGIIWVDFTLTDVLPLR